MRTYIIRSSFSHTPAPTPTNPPSMGQSPGQAKRVCTPINYDISPVIDTSINACTPPLPMIPSGPRVFLSYIISFRLCTPYIEYYNIVFTVFFFFLSFSPLPRIYYRRAIYNAVMHTTVLHTKLFYTTRRSSIRIM